MGLAPFNILNLWEEKSGKAVKRAAILTVIAAYCIIASLELDLVNSELAYIATI